MENNSQAVRVIGQNKRSNLTEKISGGAIFGALSVVVGYYIAPILPRVPNWGIAYFDPVSWLWILSFLIFGIEAGLITTVIGFLGLFLSDPTGIGPFFKLAATIWFIIIPYGYLKMKRLSIKSSELETPKNYIISFTIGWMHRIVVMVVMNLIFITYIWRIPIQFLSFPLFGLDEFSGVAAVVTFVIFINTVQTISDALVPYLLVFRTPIKNYRIW